MDLDAIFTDDARIPFGGHSASLALLLDPKSLLPIHGEDPWPRATVALRTRGIAATMTAHFFPDALATFARDLAIVQRTLQGAVTLDSENGDFRLTVTFGRQGHATLTGHLQPMIESCTIVNYEIQTDQSYLNTTLAALANLPEASH